MNISKSKFKEIVPEDYFLQGGGDLAKTISLMVDLFK